METLRTLLAPDLIRPGSCWTLLHTVDGFGRATGTGLTTQARSGRSIRLLEQVGSRLRVQVLEDGYRCWMDRDALLGRAEQRGAWRPSLLTAAEIRRRLPAVLAWSARAEQQPNHYLWGGTSEPNMDCSGLMQMAFASQGIWIPRDAYQQERFCQPVAGARQPAAAAARRPDLFGPPRRCTHVGPHLGGGVYRHSSGIEHGRNGIGVDSLIPQTPTPWQVTTETNCAVPGGWCAATTAAISTDRAQERPA